MSGNDADPALIGRRSSVAKQPNEVSRMLLSQFALRFLRQFYDNFSPCFSCPEGFQCSGETFEANKFHIGETGALELSLRNELVYAFPDRANSLWLVYCMGTPE